jgi:hypothetical protein
MSTMTSATLSFVDERQVPTVIQPMLPLHECADPAPTETLHSVGDSAAVEESAVEPLHFTADPTAAESVDEPLQSVAYSDAVDDASTKTSCS